VRGEPTAGRRPRRGPRVGWGLRLARILTLCAILAAVVGLGVAGIRAWRARQGFLAPLDRGRALWKLRRFDEAIESFQAARAVRPDDPAPLWGLAECYKGKGQFATATAWALQAIELDPTHRSRLLAAELELLAAGPWEPLTAPPGPPTQSQRIHLEKAVEHARAAAEAHPASAPAHRLLAEAKARLGEVAAAIPSARRAVELDPDSVSARLLAADLFYLNGSVREALACCEEAAKRLEARQPRGKAPSPGQAGPAALEGREKADLLRALARAAKIAASLQRGEQAAGYWTRFLAAGGNAAQGRVGLCVAYFLKGDFERAIEEGNQASQLIGAGEPDWDLHFYRGQAYLRLGRCDRAAQDLRVALTRRDDPQARYYLGLALLGSGERGVAREAFEAALALDPAHHGAREQLAALLEADGETQKALDLWRRAVAAQPKSREAHQALADFCLRHGLDAEAEAALRALAALEPRSARAAATLAAFYLDRDDPEQALALAREAADLDPADPALAHLAGRAAAALGRVWDAEEHFAKALQLRPDYAPAYLDWAMMHRSLRDDLAAWMVLQRAVKAAPASLDLRYAYARFCLTSGREIEGLETLRELIARDPRDVNARTTYVEHLLARGDKDAAGTQAREIADLLPKSLEAQALLARVCRARNEWDRVLAVYSQMADLPGGGGPLLPQRLAAHLHEGLYEAALELAKDAPRAHPAQRRQLELAVAVARFYAGKRQEALEAVGGAASADPRDPDASFALALMQLEMGLAALSAPGGFALPESALAAWGDLVRRKDQRPDEARRIARILLHASVYEQAGWHDTAAEAVAEILRFAPDCLIACCMVPSLWHRAGDLPKALAACRQGIINCPEFGLHGRLILADLLMLEGNVADAKATYEEYAAKEREPFDARTKLALLAEAAGDTTAALAHWRTILARQPRHMPAANNAAWLLATQLDPDLDAAAAAATNALEAAPEDPAVLDTVGWVDYLRGETVRAVDRLERAVKAAPHRAHLLLHLGLGYASRGMREQAERTLRAAIAAGAREPYADEARQALRELR